MQTIHERSAAFIRRGYELSVFEEAVKNLNKINVQVIVHVILGLPFESKREMLETVEYLSDMSPSGSNPLAIHGIKLQLLHVLRGTDLERYLPYFKTLSLEEYVQLVIECLERLPQDIVVHRVTGDGPKRLLLAPMWSASKKTAMNTINRQLKIKDSWQGKQR